MEPNPHEPDLPSVDHAGPEGRPIPSDVRELHERVVALDAAVRSLSQMTSSQARSRGASNGRSSAGRRFSPLVTGEELVVLADWVDFYQECYDIGTMWLKTCWWRHSMVVQELAALHGAWMAVYQSDEPVHGAAALDWHEAAVRCRARIKEAMSNGPGCSLSTHRPDDPMSREELWIEEGRVLRRWVAAGGSDSDRRAATKRNRGAFKTD
jgi:hypothetical protein